MKVIIRTDASSSIGSGHVMRCLALADELTNSHCTVIFACMPHDGNLISYIEERNYDVLKLSLPSSAYIQQYDNDYKVWLQREPSADAEEFLSLVSCADIVVTDHYAIDYEWQSLVKNKLSCMIVAIDDLVRNHMADIIIDQTYGRKPEEYNSNSVVLSGTDFAIIKEDFSLTRARALTRKFDGKKTNVLISMGGIDLPNATSLVLLALVPSIDASFTVLLSKRAPHYHEVLELCKSLDNVKHIEFSSNMANLMLEHDIAIGAPGSTSWERACLGLPSIIIPLAENQTEICKQLTENEIALQIKLEEIDDLILEKFHNLCLNWNYYFRNNINICDGKGTKRVIKELFRLINENNNYM